MKTNPDCLVCVFRQALNADKIVSGDPTLHEKVLRTLAASLVAEQSGVSLGNIVFKKSPL